MSERKDKAMPALTIVGGQPKASPRSRKAVKVPVGVEQVLFHAAQDHAFKARLLADRKAAIADCGVHLRPSERAILEAVPDTALETMIRHLVPVNSRGSRLMRVVAAAAASLAAGTASAGCSFTQATIEPYEGGADAGIRMEDSSTPPNPPVYADAQPDARDAKGGIYIVPEGGAGDAGVRDGNGGIYTPPDSSSDAQRDAGPDAGPGPADDDDAGAD